MRSIGACASCASGSKGWRSSILPRISAGATSTRVYFGAWVHMESVGGELRWYRIVGPDEFDMAEDYISMDSPFGRSLMGRHLDDEITVELPGGAATLTVVAIS